MESLRPKLEPKPARPSHDPDATNTEPYPMISIIAAAAIAVCSWSSPGADRYIGDHVAAVDTYKDLSAHTRSIIKHKVAKRAFDDVVEIRRGSVKGDAGYEYASALTGMHFGRGRVCAKVDRQAWTATAVERGLVFCAGDACIVIPTVCGNVSRIERKALAKASDQLPGVQAPGAPAPGPGEPLGATSEAHGPAIGPAIGAASGSHQALDPQAAPGSFASGVAPPVFGGGSASPSSGGWSFVPSAGGSASTVGVIPAVPEPSTYALFAVGLLSLYLFGRGRK